MAKDYDVIIIGGGPAGLSAGIYTARARLRTLLIEKAGIGGQIVNALLVENYPGYVDGVSGLDLTEGMHKQAEKFGMETLFADVSGLQDSGKIKTVSTSQGDYAARAVIIASGSERQKLGVPGEAEFLGRGVSYCATCDGAFFRDRQVAVVGGGNAAITEALELTHFASKVLVIHRRNELRATKIVQEKAFAEPKLEFVWDSAVEAILGDGTVEKVRVKNLKTGEQKEIAVDGVFVNVGFRPASAFLQGLVALDQAGAVAVDEEMATSVPGIFAAGDVRNRSIRQVIGAAGDGAVAAVSAGKYLGG